MLNFFGKDMDGPYLASQDSNSLLILLNHQGLNYVEDKGTWCWLNNDTFEKNKFLLPIHFINIGKPNNGAIFKVKVA